jgi:formate hydrogenlyase transcriptional activator
VPAVPSETMEAICQAKWPGNIRELENFIERSVILTRGDILQAPIRELVVDEEQDEDLDTLKGAERQQILRALRDSYGQLSGPHGAAARLGLPRSTLQSKLKQMGIDHRTFR